MILEFLYFDFGLVLTNKILMLSTLTRLWQWDDTFQDNFHQDNWAAVISATPLRPIGALNYMYYELLYI